MKSDIDTISTIMGLSPYQTNVLKAHPDIYKLSGLVKRGRALYAPRNATSNKFLNFLHILFCGTSADLIGNDKMLVRNSRGIVFSAGGFYSAPIGRRYRYYADDNGNIITRETFMKETYRK